MRVRVPAYLNTRLNLSKSSPSKLFGYTAYAAADEIRFFNYRVMREKCQGDFIGAIMYQYILFDLNGIRGKKEELGEALI